MLSFVATKVPAVIRFSDTKNSVSIEVPKLTPPTNQPALDGFDQIVLRFERECTASEESDIRGKKLSGLNVDQDVARAFWLLFEAIREAALRRDNTVFIYPVVPTHELQANPLVRGYAAEWSFDGQPLIENQIRRGLPVIQVTDDWWIDAVGRLAQGQNVPVYTRFALDATYFAEHDPTRGIIMACAAWGRQKTSRTRVKCIDMEIAMDAFTRRATRSRSIPPWPHPLRSSSRPSVLGFFNPALSTAFRPRPPQDASTG